MTDVIGFQDGIDASINNLQKLDPKHPAGYEKLRGTLDTLKATNNEVAKKGGLEDRIEALEAWKKNRPF
jgi:hypothetical protein